MKELSVRSVVDDGLWSASNAVRGFYLPQLEHADRVLRVCRTLSHTLTALQALPSEASGRGELAVEVEIPFLQYVAPAVRPHVERVGRALSKQYARVRALAQEDLPAKVDQLFQNLRVCLHVAAWGLSAIPAGAALYRCVAALALPFEPHAAHLLDVPDATWVELEAASARAAAAPRALPATCFSGLEDFRETLQQKVVLAARLPGLVRGARSVLLYGPRGCGKSLLALCALREAPHEKYLAHANLLASSVNARDLVRAADESARAAARRAAFVLENVDGLPPSAWNSGTHTVVFGTTANARATNLFTSFEHRVFVDVPSAAVRRALVEQSVAAALGLSETSPQDLQYRAQLRAHPTYQRALDALVSALAPDYDRLRTELLAPAGGREPSGYEKKKSGYETRAWLKYYLTRFAAENERAAVVQLVRYGTTDELQQAADALAARARAEEKAAHALDTTLASELQALLRALDELSENLAGVRPVPAGGAALSSAALSLSALSRTKFVAFMERSLREYTLPTLLAVAGVSAGLTATAMVVPWAALGSAAYTSGAAALGSATTLANSTLVPAASAALASATTFTNSTLVPAASAALGSAMTFTNSTLAPAASAALASATTLASSTLVPVAYGTAAALGEVASAAALGTAAAALLPGPAAFARQLLGAQGAALAPRLAADFRKRTNLDPLHALAAELDVERARVREALRRAQLYPGDEAVELAAVRAAESLHALLQRYAAAAERAHSSFGEYALALRARADECAKVHSTLDFAADARTTTPEDVEQEFNAFPVVPLERAGAYSAAAAARAPYVAAQHANAVSAKDLADATRTVTWFNRFWLDFGGMRSDAEVAAGVVPTTPAKSFLDVDEKYFNAKVAPHLLNFANKITASNTASDLLAAARQKQSVLDECIRFIHDNEQEVKKLEASKKANDGDVATTLKELANTKKLIDAGQTVRVISEGGWFSSAITVRLVDVLEKQRQNRIKKLEDSKAITDKVNAKKTEIAQKNIEKQRIQTEYNLAYTEYQNALASANFTLPKLEQVSFAARGGESNPSPEQKIAVPPDLVRWLDVSLVSSVSSAGVEALVQSVFKVGERCGARVLVSAWFAALYSRNQENVDGTLVEHEMRYSVNKEDVVTSARIHVLVAFLRYVLVAALVQDPGARDNAFFTTLDLGRDLSDVQRVERQMLFASITGVGEKHWKAYANPLNLEALKVAVADSKWFLQAWRAQSFAGAQRLFGEWSASGAVYCSQSKEAEEPRPSAWRLNGGSSTVLHAKLLAHAGTDWTNYFRTGERSPGVILENYLKYNLQEALRALPCIPGHEDEAQELVDAVQNALDKVTDDALGTWANTSGARAPDLDEERERTFDSLVAPEVNTTSFDETRTQQLCGAFFAFQDAATPVWWHAELDAAALFALVLRAEPHPMAFTRVDERAAWGVPHVAYAVLFYRFEEVLRVMLPFGYTLRDAYRAAYRTFSISKTRHEHVFFAWALEHFRNEFRTLRSWLEQAVPDAVRAAVKPDGNKPTGKSGEPSGGKLAAKFDQAKFQSVFREKTGFDLTLDAEHVQFLEDSRAPNEGPPYAAVEYGAESSAAENLDAFEKALAVANPSSASKTQQPQLHKERWSRETVAAHALLAAFARAPVPSAALAELSSQLQAFSASNFKKVLEEKVPELVRKTAQTKTQPELKSEGSEDDGKISKMSSNTFSRDGKNYIRVWNGRQSIVHEVYDNGTVNTSAQPPGSVINSEPRVGKMVRIVTLAKKSNRIDKRGWYDVTDAKATPFFPTDLVDGTYQELSNPISSRTVLLDNDSSKYVFALGETAKEPGVFVLSEDEWKLTDTNPPDYPWYFTYSNNQYTCVYDDHSKTDMWISKGNVIQTDSKVISKIVDAAKATTKHYDVLDESGNLVVHENSAFNYKWQKSEKDAKHIAKHIAKRNEATYNGWIPVYKSRDNGTYTKGWYRNIVNKPESYVPEEMPQYRRSKITFTVNGVDYHRTMGGQGYKHKTQVVRVDNEQSPISDTDMKIFDAEENKENPTVITVFDLHTKTYVPYNNSSTNADMNGPIFTLKNGNSDPEEISDSSQSKPQVPNKETIDATESGQSTDGKRVENKEQGNKDSVQTTDTPVLSNITLTSDIPFESQSSFGSTMEKNKYTPMFIHQHRKWPKGDGNSGSSLASSDEEEEAERKDIWTWAEDVYATLTLRNFSELVHAALDARLLYVAAKNLSDTFVAQLDVARNTLKTPSAAAALLQPAQLRSNFKEAAKQQPGWDALAVAPRRGLRARSAEQPRELSPQEADQKVEQAFRALRELQHARRLAPYGYSARDIADATRQGVEDFVYSTLDAVPADAECAPFCSETSVDAKGERVKRCKAKECSNAVFGVFEVAQRVEHVKEFVCGPLYGGSARDRTCGMPVAELSSLFAAFLKMYKENPQPYTKSALESLTRQLETELNRADALTSTSRRAAAHTLVPTVTRAATLQSTQPVALYELFRHICVVLESKRSSVTRDEYLPLLLQHLMTDL
jgi:DNA polymerase III delta prime subunit